MAVYPLQPGETRTVALIRTNRRFWPVGAARSAARTRAGRGAKQPPLIIQKPRIGSAGMWAEGPRTLLYACGGPWAPAVGGRRPPQASGLVRHLFESANGVTCARIWRRLPAPATFCHGFAELKSVLQTPHRIGPRAATAVETRMRRVIRPTPRTGPEFDADQLRSSPQRSEDTRASIYLNSAGPGNTETSSSPLAPAHRHDDC
jgi:hypothetical protein